MNQQKLIKLLQQTQSEHDNESLTAIRKANRLLEAAGHNWESLFRSLQQPPRQIIFGGFDPAHGFSQTVFFTRSGSFTTAGPGGDQKS